MHEPDNRRSPQLNLPPEPPKGDVSYRSWALLGILASQVDWCTYQSEKLRLHGTAIELHDIAQRLRGMQWQIASGELVTDYEGPAGPICMEGNTRHDRITDDQ